MHKAQQDGAWYVAGRCGDVLLSSIGVSIVLVVVAQYSLNVVLVVRPTSLAAVTELSPPAPRLTATARPVHRGTGWTLAQLPSIVRSRVLEYFNPGTAPPPTQRPRPLCPLPGTDSQ